MGNKSYSTYVDILGKNDVELVKSFIKSNNIKMEMTDVNGSTPLQIAVENDADIEIIKLLLEKKSDPNTIDEFSKKPLIHLLCSFNKPSKEKIELLLKHKANINVVDCSNPGKKSVINTYLENPRVDKELLKYLIEQKAKLDLDDCYHNPLQQICDYGRNLDPEILELLLSNNCNPNSYTKNDYSSGFFNALSNRSVNVDIVKLFVKYKANVREISPYKQSTAMAALSGKSSQYIPILSFLLENKCNINHPDERKETLLYHSLRLPCDIINFILQNGLDIRTDKQSYHTYLGFALFVKNPETIYLLLLHGARLEARDHTKEQVIQKICLLLEDYLVDGSPKWDPKYYHYFPAKIRIPIQSFFFCFKLFSKKLNTLFPKPILSLICQSLISLSYPKFYKTDLGIPQEEN